MKKKPRTIDDYLTDLPEPQRAVLERLRRTIRSAAPEAVECISYSLPAFRLQGRLLVAFGAADHGGSFYPMSAATIRALAPSLTKFETSKGTIRFSLDQPLPAALVRTLVTARIRENRERESAKANPTRPRTTASCRGIPRQRGAKSVSAAKGSRRPPRRRPAP